MRLNEKNRWEWLCAMMLIVFLIVAPAAAEEMGNSGMNVTTPYESVTEEIQENVTEVEIPVPTAETTPAPEAPVMERHRLAIVTGDPCNTDDLNNATLDAPLDVTLLNNSEALTYDFSSEALIFAASVDEAALEQICATMKPNVSVVVYDLPDGMDVGTPADATITAYWTNCCTENFHNMIVYMDNIYFENDTPVDPPVIPECETEHVITIITNDPERQSSVTNATGMTDLIVTLCNETEAGLHDFSADELIFAASVNNGTLALIDSAITENTTLVVYEAPVNSTIGTPADETIIQLWEEGGDENVLNLLRHIEETYFGNETALLRQQATLLAEAEGEELSIVIIIGGESYVPMYLEAGEKCPANVTVYSSKLLPDDLNLTGYDLIFMEMFGAGIDIIEPAVNNATAAGVPVAVIHAGTYEYLGTVNMTPHAYVEEYWENSGPENAQRLINYLSAAICGADIPIEDPIQTPSECIYHPDSEELFETLDAYMEWYATNGTYDLTKPTIGIIFYDSHYKSGDLAGDHAIMREFEAQGANILTVFLDYNNPHVIDRFFVKDGVPVVDAIVNTRCFRFYGSGSNPERGIEELTTYNIPIINALVDYSKTPEEWVNCTDGITSSKVGYSIGMPELDGQTEFIWTAGRGIDPRTEAIGFRPITPVAEQISWLVERVIALSDLRNNANSGKKVAIVYYNHGGGRDNLGASYLDIVPSLTNLLDAMEDEGYAIDGEVPTEDELLDLMLLQGRNVGTWAPGELDSMVEEGDVVLLPAEQYAEWFHELPADKQEEVIAKWGEPPGEIMVYNNGGQDYLVIPTVSFGNVILTPQPTRGWLQDEAVLYHDTDLPPHHQYIAFYLWLQNQFDADAIVHFGRHGTQEWLPGKERGLSATDDWPPLLIGDIPNIYPYIMDGLGEGTQAKRRGNAVIIDHLTPPIVAAGLYGDFSTLHEKIHAYSATNITVKEEYRKSITTLYQEMNINATLDCSVDEIEAMSDDEFSEFINGDLHEYLHELGDEFIPYGLHILGEPPEDGDLVSLVRAMLGEEFEEDVGTIYPEPDSISAAHGNCTVIEALLTEVLLNGTDPAAAQETVLGDSSAAVTADLNTAIDYAADIEACSVEIPAIINALGGGYIPPNTGGDPVRSPESLPTGNNFHSFDSRLMPTEEAWNVGVQMAEEMLEQYGEAHDGAYPDKAAFVLWACESMRHEGVTECEALYLLGVKPVWSKGKVKGVELIPSAELGRPRIDVVFIASGLYRDTFSDKIELLDDAVRLAAQAEDDLYPNYVSENSEELYATLITNGYDEETARRLSMSRIFSAAPGAYGTGLSSAIDSSDTWENEDKLTDLYLSKLGYVYNGEDWGEPNKALFRDNLGDVDAAVHSRSSNLYGLVDNDDCFQYFGGLSMVIKSISGTGPDMFITDLRSAGKPQTTTLSDFILKELDARYFNPKWIEGMMEHGYAGARYMDKKFLENLWGWSVTNPDIISSDVWDKVFDVYVNDKNNLGLDEFFAENPYAYQSMVGRMMEAARKGYWDADSEALETLAREYQESVRTNGVTCCHHTCGNLALSSYIQGVMNALAQKNADDSSDDPSAEVLKQTAAAAAPTTEIPLAVEDDQSGAESMTNTTVTGGYGENAQEPAAPQVAPPDVGVSGQVMEKVTKNNADSGSTSTPIAPIIIVCIIIAAVFVGIRWKKI
ncbi:cobaltochelatase subunit CobN [Methanogenium organophilum]|uniref:Cobaltochelatase subunit CobN n=1 Tax=Methanogenium organophilum TaxID=2199 RepID=A0A9X9S4Q8_METOG|nr:cobaltochelatase subunit CobN [Methanogenium organophilum]WAI01743.1 cobaltochelatase subunit CobN [Methanogenium organophilum]